MKASLFVATALHVTIVSSLLAQNPTRRPSPGTPTEDEVVRVTTNLVQVDAVVTDKNGKPVTDLRAEDFEIFEDGRAQPVTTFAYVSTESKPLNPPATNAAVSPANDGVPIPMAPLSRDKVRRTILLVVDDMGLSLQSLQILKPALKRFVEYQMQPGDQVAVIRTGGGSGYYLTSDKRQLLSSINRLQWQCRNRVGLTPLQPSICLGLQEVLPRTLQSLIYIVEGVKALPGRKTLLFFTDSFDILKNPTFGNKNEGVSSIDIDHLNEKLEQMSQAIGAGLAPNPSDTRGPVLQLIDASNAASTVIYTLDARGLVVTSPTAADQGATKIVGDPVRDIWAGNLLDRRGSTVWETQSGLMYLAHETGGYAVVNNNDIGKGIDRILTELTGYYLIGYRPSETTFARVKERAPYHKITMRVLRPGLKVRSRKGFYGAPDQNRQAAMGDTMEQQVVKALESPFAQGGVGLRLTSLFVNNEKGSLIHVLLHIDARDLAFGTTADGWHQATMNVLASTYGDNGLIADYLSRSETIRARGRTYAGILRNGLRYDLYVPAKKPGDYQVRAAVRDAATGRTGSAFQFVEVPELKKGQLALSGIVLSSPEIDLGAITAAPPTQGLNDNDEGLVRPTPAARRFASGMLLDYRYMIYNARPLPQGGLPNVSAQVRLFREGQLVLSQEASAIDTRNVQLDDKRLSATGQLRLSRELVPGQYVLQIIVTDAGARAHSRPASQWIDFEVVK